jgi:hypothetical protein
MSTNYEATHWAGSYTFIEKLHDLQIKEIKSTGDRSTTLKRTETLSWRATQYNAPTTSRNLTENTYNIKSIKYVK